MTKSKKKWTRPQLVVLERGRPEESVLSVCKVPVWTGGPLANDCLNLGGVGNCFGTGSS